MATINAYFPVFDPATHTILQVGSTQYNPAITAAELVVEDPTFSLLPNSDGETMLCAEKDDASPLYLIALNGQSQYSIKAADFHSCDYVGGHPIHRPGPRIA